MHKDTVQAWQYKRASRIVKINVKDVVRVALLAPPQVGGYFPKGQLHN